MANKTNEDGWIDIPEFDPEEAKRIADQQDREIDAEIRRREDQ